MTFPFPYGGITITVERPVYNRYNDVDHYDEHTIENCTEYPSGSDEASPNVGVSDARTLLVPSGSDIQALDRIVLHNGDDPTPPAKGTPQRGAATYNVVGRPKDWTHAMTGWQPGMTLDIEKVT